jgi:hypothetical protein
MQPRVDTEQAGGQPQPLNDLYYDLATVISNCGQAEAALKQYVEDARKESNEDAVRLFEQIRLDQMRHCERAVDVIASLAKKGKL